MMPHRIRLKQHPALKHGAYSALAVLPGEDRAEFEKLHRDLIAECSASGPLEHHYVAELARFIWRLQNLGTLRVAKLAREPFICTERFTSRYSEISPDLAEVQAAQCAATVKAKQEEAQQGLGDLYGLVAVGEVATIPYLEDELRLRERLGDMIETCIKRLMQAKGLKSISMVSAPPPSRRRLLPQDSRGAFCARRSRKRLIKA
jgi:hypothetical protein